MDQHPVPRQITTFEFKLIGFMTLRQFLYLAVFFPAGFIFYKIIPLPYVNIFVGIIVGVIGLLFAFVPIQDRPLEEWIRNFIKRLNSPTQFSFKKKSDSIQILDNLYFVSDPHVALVHVDTKEKLNKYLQDTADQKKISPDTIQQSKKQNHINELLNQTKNTNPDQIKKANINIPKTATAPAADNHETIKQPFVTGIVKNRRQIPLPGIIVSIKDSNENTLRLLKTNPHGIFATFSQLPAGEYLFEISDPNGNYFFDTMNITLEEKQKKPLLFYSKEIL